MFRRRSVKSPFELQIIKDDELTMSLNELKLNYSVAKRNALALRLTTIAMSVVSTIRTRHIDDVIGEAFENLIEILDGICEGRLADGHENYMAYISFSLRARLIRYEEEDKIIPVPQASLHAGAQAPKVEANSFPNCSCSDVDDLLIQDVLEHCTENEKRILQLRLEAYSDAEIAAKLGVTRQAIFATRKNIGAKVARVIFPEHNSAAQTGGIAGLISLDY